MDIFIIICIIFDLISTSTDIIHIGHLGQCFKIFLEPGFLYISKSISWILI